MNIRLMNGTGYGHEVFYTKNIESLQIKFVGNVPICDFAILTVNNNGKRGVYRVINDIVTIDKEFLNIGQLLLTIDYYVGKQKVNTIQITPITIKLVEGEYEIIPELIELRQKMEELRESNNNLSAKYEKLCDLINALYNIDVRGIMDNE